MPIAKKNTKNMKKQDILGTHSGELDDEQFIVLVHQSNTNKDNKK